MKRVPTIVVRRIEAVSVCRSRFKARIDMKLTVGTGSTERQSRGEALTVGDTTRGNERDLELLRSDQEHIAFIGIVSDEIGNF